MKRNLIAVFLFFSFIACDPASTKKNYPLHLSDVIMGTSYTIKVTSLPGSIEKDELISQIKRRLETLDQTMSTYRQDSELSQFNRSQSLQWQNVSKSLLTVLKEAKRINELTAGAFDITVGPIVNLWGFGPDPMLHKAPGSEVIEAALKKTGSEYLLLDEVGQKIKKTLPDLYLDLSAIAKGYAVDVVGELLEQQGVLDYMVEIGGELRLKGTNANNKPWRIAIEKPTSEARVIQKVLPLSDISLATSGDYRNYFEVGNVRFSHTIDPRTGKPISHKLASITILSHTTMEADATATALMVLGPVKGYELAQEKDIAALFIIKINDGFVEKASSAFLEKF